MGIGSGWRIANQAHLRIVNGILSRHEHIALQWFAPRIPRSLMPDHLTGFALFGAVLASIGLAASNVSNVFLALVILGLVINWLGDSLDGTLARYRKIERPRYGFFVDHICDAGAQILIGVGLGLSPYMRLDVACLALVAYLVLSVYTLVKLHVTRTMQLTYLGIGPTEVRALIVAGAVASLCVDLPAIEIAGQTMTIFDAVALVFIALALAGAMRAFFRDARHLARLDPSPALSLTETIMDDPQTPNGELVREVLRCPTR